MLTIGQLAAYAGVTVAAVRHYHKVALLPEPQRDRSGYRSYDADAVVRLIRIHVLASAGVPLSRVEALLSAEPDEFASSVRDIDRRLREEARRIQDTRKRLAQLASGDSLALPASVVGYLDRVRGLGVPEEYLEKERDAWIMLAAQVPHQIDEIIAQKHRDLDDPEMVRLYALFGQALHWTAEDPRVVEAADLLDRIATRAVEAGNVSEAELDDQFVALLDATMAESAPAAARLLELMAERGWKGWTHIERRKVEER